MAGFDQEEFTDYEDNDTLIATSNEIKELNRRNEKLKDKISLLNY